MQLGGFPSRRQIPAVLGRGFPYRGGHRKHFVEFLLLCCCFCSVFLFFAPIVPLSGDHKKRQTSFLIDWQDS